MKVAVLIPLYNHARFIGAATASLRAQSRPPDRIIIIDDGSTDGSLNALMAASEEGPLHPSSAAATNSPGASDASKIVTQTEVIIQPNSGTRATINRAAAMAGDCDYLAILNSDDCYHPRRIERCLAFLQDHPQYDLVCTRPRLIDEQGDVLPPDSSRARWLEAAWSYSAGFDGSHAPDVAEWLGLANFTGTTSNVFARASFLREHPLEDYRFAHGYHLLVVAALENKLGILDAELLDYRIHSGHDEETEPEGRIREMLRVNLDISRELSARLGDEPVLRAAFTRYQRALWSNVSATRADLLALVHCQALALLPEGVSDRLVNQLDRQHYPEIAEFPNSAVIKVHQPGLNGSGAAGGLADKFYKLKTQLSNARADARPWAEYRQLQEGLVNSRWYALGRLLGCARGIVQAGGNTAPEKLASLRECIAASLWLRLGSRLGIGSARKLLALSRATA